MISEAFLLVKSVMSQKKAHLHQRIGLNVQISPRRAQIDDLWAPVAILLKSCAFKAVKGIADAFSAADDAFVLVVPEGALVTDANECGRAYVGVADRALAVTLVAESSERDSSLFAAHDEIGMVAWHVCAEVRRESEVKVLEMWGDNYFERLEYVAETNSETEY
jgi:hypothetical protein